VPAASAHAYPDQADEAGGLSLQVRPINLVDIGRALGESARAEGLGDIAIRAWRDDLTVIRDSLSYARAILAADVTILAGAGGAGAADQQGIVDELPSMLVASTPEGEWSEHGEVDLDPDIDEGLFIRTDHLLAVHREMARVDLASSAARIRVLELIEEQLAMLTERQAAVEARLQHIRTVIFRRYRDGVASAQDQPA
jgi:hypothetical protein